MQLTIVMIMLGAISLARANMDAMNNSLMLVILFLPAGAQNMYGPIHLEAWAEPNCQGGDTAITFTDNFYGRNLSIALVFRERSASALSEYHKACASCRRVGEYITRLLYQGRRIAPQWDIPIKAYREEPSMGLAVRLVYRLGLEMSNQVYSGVEDMADEQMMRLNWTSVPPWI
ncbi:uncharacterized protein BO88DRAFT_415875 [Aspergillus vadensis CBS 113365]|uniref:Uncharacterized protein n=1 Tax=Aspergillus vadensis (strain CBS 113365 / IMI 142717 / IBT 24658) TaxID=1448311 RepID=A0A319B886_ASPVC|nr:hypothetical protein BO88DRAFT_415875 [Aspergillus vadensis CBS 113365]PYH68091.1 hypothetical protein BO88DRAFT_415875 [Aspergillus vadensis CBS 113365]